MFRQGNVVMLQSAVSGRGLCIDGGKVSGEGIRDLKCKIQFAKVQIGSF